MPLTFRLLAMIVVLIFLGAVVAQHHLYSLIGQSPTPVSEAEMREQVRAAIAMFLARYGLRPEGDQPR